MIEWKFFLSANKAKLYILSTINTLLMPYKWGLVCSKMINHGLNHGLFSLPFNFLGLKMLSDLKNLDL